VLAVGGLCCLRSNRPVVLPGKHYARNIKTDVYSSWHQLMMDQAVYNFTTDVYFFRKGWDFPGRDVNETMQLPLRIVNTGNMSASRDGPITAFEDIWDLFMMVRDPVFVL
jgi:hypothetical protein